MNLAVISDADTIVVVGLLFTAVTIGIGLVTIVAVFSQIDLARIQINLAREELEIVRVDLAQSTAAIEKSNRESQLWIYGMLLPLRTAIIRKAANSRSLDVFELDIFIENKGEIVDLDSVVIVGFHSSFQFIPRKLNEEWHPYALNINGPYDEFMFLKFESKLPIYSGDFIELPMICLRNVLQEYDLHNFNIIGRVSSNYKQSPKGNGMWFKLKNTNMELELSEIVNVRDNSSRAFVGPFSS